MIDEQFSKFLGIFKKLQVNIPFADALEQMPHYAKFMNEIMSKKRKIDEQGTINLSEQCSAIIQRKLLEKLKDPGSFTILYSIGGQTFEKALCDLGASINLMPSSILKKLNIGDLTPTSISLRMAARSVAFPWGIVDDVLVKVDKFIFPVDFVVLDMEEDREVPIILGRPFLATGQALINIREENLTLRVNEEEVKFNIPQAMKFPSEEPSCKKIEVIQACTKIHFQELIRTDPSEKCLVGSLSAVYLDREFLPCADEVVETILALENKKEAEVIEEAVKTTDGLVFKQLPEHLDYSFLGDNYKKPVIISTDLTKEEEQKLLEVLRQH